MTGHTDGDNDTLSRSNDRIRDSVREQGKVLYDFADIESYDPDNTYFSYVNDNCDYYNSSGQKLGNWAEEWQATHIIDVEWYDCPCAHSKPLNGNQKAYAAWWLWTKIAGWAGPGSLYVDDSDTISAATGGRINFCLEAGKVNKERMYLMLGSVTGTSPGTILPGGSAILPLNWDAFTDIALFMINTPVFFGFLGYLDASGTATAQLCMPPVPGFAGATMYYAYALNKPWDFVSNPIAVDITF